MAALVATISFHFSQPWWLLLGALAVPMALWSWRNLVTLGGARRVIAIVLRCIVMLLLAAIMAGPTLTARNDQLAVIAVVDRSLSVPADQQKQCQDALGKAVAAKDPKDLLGVVDVAESATISKLPSGGPELRERNTALAGTQSKLSAGIDMAMAIAPPGAAVRILLASDGNETAGDLREAARVAAANGIPIDVFPQRYNYPREVVFRNLVTPVKARSNQQIQLRMVLSSTAAASGKVVVSLNGKPLGLGAGEDMGLRMDLKAGTNVKTVPVPVGSGGMHEYEATFIPDDPKMDSIEANNRASAITYVAGPGRVLVVDEDGTSGEQVAEALQKANINTRHINSSSFPQRLAELMDCDAIILANVNCGQLSMQQQDMICRYVSETGGGLVMIGGPESFGAGGWIGSSVADILPVNLDPSQKKQMPRGALALIMHACEMPDGNYWGKQVAKSAVDTLSRRDLIGVLDYSWDNKSGKGGHWVYDLSEVGDRTAVKTAIDQMQMGDMPDFAPPMQSAYDKLSTITGLRHVIIISDGDPGPPSPQLLASYKKAGITVTTVTVYPHGGGNSPQMEMIAKATGGRSYLVSNPKELPQIFIKEAQLIRRSLLVEEDTTLKLTGGSHQILSGLKALPHLDGFVLTDAKGGLSQMLLTNAGGDPILATMQAGMGRTLAFTSSADSRWAKGWLAWGGFKTFWEQAIRWVGKAPQDAECDIFPDVQGREVTITVESVDASGKFVQYSEIVAQVISPEMEVSAMSLTQVGPGKYRGTFQATSGGSYLVNLRYKKVGEGGSGMVQTAVNVPLAPEFRDLTDNAALLSEVAAVTGGRVIDDPAAVNLFDRAGVKIPESAQTAMPPLIYALLAAFLLDVAVRRIAVDFRAMFARAWSNVPSLRRKPKPADERLGRLAQKRKAFLDELSARKKTAGGAAAGGARYESTRADVSELEAGQPAATSAPAESSQQAAQATAGSKTPPPLPPKTAGSLGQLLQAKKRAQDRLKGKQ